MIPTSAIALICCNSLLLVSGGRVWDCLGWLCLGLYLFYVFISISFVLTFSWLIVLMLLFMAYCCFYVIFSTSIVMLLNVIY